MKVLRQRKYLFALLALLVVFAGCKGESPTAPSTGTTGPGGSPGGGTPPTGAVITLAASNATPLAGSTTTITATVSVNGNPAPNGTAVEFSTTPIGIFQDSGTNTTIRTTTNGVATATVTAPNPGTATITAVVNNVSRQITVTFQARPVTPPTPDTAPAITAINPNQGRPEGGEVVTITGRNFRGPVRVFFDFGNGVTREAIVTSVTGNQIQVLTPSTDLGTGQTQNATIVVFTEQGTAAEQRITGAFTFRRASLTPRVTTISPDSGPISGGTRITIFGDGFEAPVQVSFGSIDANIWSQMQVLTVTFNQIVAVTPTARDLDDLSGAVTGAIDLRIININSNTIVTADNVFRYTPKAQITAVGPNVGDAFGGTRVTIDGVGFDDPVTVSLAGIAATVVRVTGTQIIAVSSPLPSPCTGRTGNVVVTNVENGDSAEGPAFTYTPRPPTIIGISPSTVSPGGTLTVTVQDPGVGINGTATVRFTVGGRTIISTPSIVTDPAGAQTFTLVLPTTGFNFPSVSCVPGGGGIGTQFGPLIVDLVFTNITTGCIDTLSQGLTILPLSNPCVQAPPQASVVAPADPACPGLNTFAATPAAGGTATASIQIRNAVATGGLALTVTPTSTGSAEFTVPTGTITLPASSSRNITVTFDPSGVGTRTGTITLQTNDPANPTIDVCVTGTGT
jgi:hypothetical protein